MPHWPQNTCKICLDTYQKFTRLQNEHSVVKILQCHREVSKSSFRYGFYVEKDAWKVNSSTFWWEDYSKFQPPVGDLDNLQWGGPVGGPTRPKAKLGLPTGPPSWRLCGSHTGGWFLLLCLWRAFELCRSLLEIHTISHPGSIVQFWSLPCIRRRRRRRRRPPISWQILQWSWDNVTKQNCYIKGKTAHCLRVEYWLE